MNNNSCSNCGSDFLEENGFATTCPACLLELGLTFDAEDYASIHSEDSIRFGDYDLINEIARGGQGVVYRAWHRVLKREVALKTIPSTHLATETNLSRLRHEAQTIADLDHPAIVPIYEIGDINGQLYFTMKLIDGVSLSQRAKDHSISAKQAVEIIRDSARALQHAHEKGVLHRDIKPSNIILDADEKPHIVDFGLAKLLEIDGDLTRTNEAIGSPSYISPEMAAGRSENANAATDVYGLGTVLYELLTGEPPFSGKSYHEIVQNVLEGDLRPPRRVQPDLDRELETISLKCLEREQSRRYTSANALSDDLDRWLSHEPILARPASIAYRSRKWIRRRGQLLLASCAAILAIGLVYFLAPSKNFVPQYDLAVVVHSDEESSKSLHDEFSRSLIGALSNIPGIEVAPRAETLQWEDDSALPQEVGKSIHAEHVLSGELKENEEGFRFEFELVESNTGEKLLSRSYDDHLAEAPNRLAQIVRLMAMEFEVELSEKNRAELWQPLTENRDAWLSYMRGKKLHDDATIASLEASISEFETAISLDPRFAEAYCGVAESHIELGYTFQLPAYHFGKARQFIDEALKQDETLTEAIIVDGVLKYFNDWDWQAAERAVEKALLLDPSVIGYQTCYLHCQKTWGDLDGAMETVLRAVAAQPASTIIRLELACASYYLGRHEEGEIYARQSIDNDSQNEYAHWHLARNLAQNGQLDEAFDSLYAIQQSSGGDILMIVSELAYISGKQGKTQEARDLLSSMRARTKGEYVDPYFFAIAYAGLGDAEAMFDALEASADNRSSWIPSFPLDPKFIPWKKHKRYIELVDRLNI